MKNYRQARIKAIIEAQIIETQEELASALKEQKIEVTQATVSRDIKALHLVKIPYGHGKYRYSFPLDVQQVHSESKMQKIFQDAVINIDFSENIVVVKTPPGAGSSVAFALDNAQWPEIIGTVAGDDTVLVVVKQKELARNVVSRMKEMSVEK